MTGAYILFYQCAPIDNWTHVTVTVSQSSSESDYIAACTAVMAVTHFRILNNELMNKYPDMVLENALLIILDIKSVVCMANNGKYNKHTRHISRRMYFVWNSEEWNIQKNVWCEGGLILTDIGTNNVSED